MPLIVLSEDRIRREIERCAATERAHRAEMRRLIGLGVAVVAGILLEVFFWGLSMHLTGDAAQAARGAATLFALTPAFAIVIWQLLRHD